MLDPLKQCQGQFAKYSRGRLSYQLTMAKKRLSDAALKFFREEGRRGGKIGGKARAKKLTDERRLEIARKAAEARWGKKEDRSKRGGNQNP